MVVGRRPVEAAARATIDRRSGAVMSSLLLQTLFADGQEDRAVQLAKELVERRKTDGRVSA